MSAGRRDRPFLAGGHCAAGRSGIGKRILGKDLVAGVVFDDQHIARARRHQSHRNAGNDGGGFLAMPPRFDRDGGYVVAVKDA